MYNAPETRRAMSVANTPKADFYASYIFSFRLVVWELLQGGRALINPAFQGNDVDRLNGLPKDDLPLQAFKSSKHCLLKANFQSVSFLLF